MAVSAIWRVLHAYSQFLQPLVAWLTKAPDNVYILQIITTNVFTP